MKAVIMVSLVVVLTLFVVIPVDVPQVPDPDPTFPVIIITDEI